jgi:hypothetical protein
LHFAPSAEALGYFHSVRFADDSKKTTFAAKPLRAGNQADESTLDSTNVNPAHLRSGQQSEIAN